jgi:hypothetical protein
MVHEPKHETLVDQRMLNAFVDLEQDPPSTFIIPSALVARCVKDAHEAWASTPGRGNDVRKRESEMRRVRPADPDEVRGFPRGWMDEWRDRWDLLACQTQHP